jgi:DnaJ-class molecular chaperone
MADFKQIDEARRLLGLDEEATMGEIKEAFRGLAVKYHPDKHRGKEKKEHEESFKKISDAKDIILNYCASYRFSFREKDVKKNTMSREEYEYLKRFYGGFFDDLGI